MELGYKNNHVGINVPFVVDPTNTLIIGTNDSNTSDLLIRLLLDDIHAGFPVVSIDPNGQINDEILKRIPRNRQKDVIVIDPSTQPFALNVFANILGSRKDLFASTLMDTLKGVWFARDTSTPVFDQYLRATLHLALSVTGTTFFSLKYILTNKDYRDTLLESIDDPVIKDFWRDFETLTPKEQRQDRSSTLNKLNAFAFSPVVRNVLDQKNNKLVFKDKVVLVTLRTRELGSENARLLGALILALLYMEDTPQNLYLSGASFGTAILGKLLTTCPSVRTTLAVQYLDEVRKDFQPTLLSGVGQIVAFKTSSRDSDTLGPDFHLNNDHYSLADMNALGPRTSYVCIDGVTTVLQPIDRTYPETHQAAKIMARCLSQYTAPLEVISNRIARFTNG